MILEQLSSKSGARNEEPNHRVAELCCNQPKLLGDIANGLESKDANLAGDCAEVMTMVAEQHPDLVIPYGGQLAGLLSHKKTRVRWEAMHALDHMAHLAPELIESLLPRLEEIIRDDESVIVRDHAVDALSGYASTGPAAAARAYPLLKIALSAWDGKQAGHALAGLKQVSLYYAAPARELRSLAEIGLADSRGVVKKAARELLTSIQEA